MNTSSSHAAAAKAGKPFFLYLALTSPHTPLVPTAQWKGKSGLGDYGDFVMETDWAAGEVLDAIDAAGIADNTLVIFTSDNGCAPYIGVKKLEAQGHFPSAEFRGYKSDIWDGGHRIPFIARWPGHVKAGSHSDQLICLTDLMATCAELLAQKLPDNAGEDSVSILPDLLGHGTKPPLLARPSCITQSTGCSPSGRATGNLSYAPAPAGGLRRTTTSR